MNSKFSSKRPLTDEEDAEIRKMIESDPDNPELTDKQLRQGKPFAEIFPDLAENISRNRGRPPKDITKKPVTIRLNARTIEKFKATGKGWQSRISDILDAAKV